MTSSGSDGQLTAAVAPSLLREMNQRLLLQHLFEHGPAIRSQLARDAGLSLPTVIAALAGLEEVGLVRVAGRNSTTHGRPAAAYEADPTSGTVVGVDVGHDWLRLLVTDLAGQRLSRLDVRNTARSTAGLVDRTFDAVTEATDRAGVTLPDVTHAVIGSPGVYDPRRGAVQYAPNLPGWQHAGLTEALSRRLGISLTMDNDANLAALGELTYGAAKDARDYVYVTIGTGLGVGLVLDGRLYRGATGIAGEAGYLPYGSKPARRGRMSRGMLEEQLSAQAVVRSARELGMATPRLSAEKVFEAARRDDPKALAAVDQTGQRLAHLVATLMALLDPELLVFGGGVGQNIDLLERPMRAELASLSPMTPTIAAGHLGQDAVLMGAVATAIATARDSVFRERIER